MTKGILSSESTYLTSGNLTLLVLSLVALGLASKGANAQSTECGNGVLECGEQCDEYKQCTHGQSSRPGLFAAGGCRQISKSALNRTVAWLASLLAGPNFYDA